MESDPKRTDEKAQVYAALKRRLWFLHLFATILFLGGGMAIGLAQSFRSWVDARVSGWPAQVAVYASVLWLGMEGVMFPLEWVRSFAVEHRFGLSNQKFPQWLWEYAKAMTLSGLIGLGLVEGLSLLLRSTPKNWWLWAALFWMAWSILLS